LVKSSLNMRLDRLKIVQSMLKSGCYLVNSAPDLFYITGVNLDGYWLCVTKSGYEIFAPPLAAEHLQRVLPGARINNCEELFLTFSAYLKKNGFKKVFVNPSRVSLALARKLRKSAGAELLDCDFAGQARLVKDNSELENIKKACKITLNAFKYARQLAKPGITETEISFKIEEYFAKNLARAAFLPIVAFGPNTANPHHLSSERKLAGNDIVLIDIGCSVNGYCSDLTRTFFLGKINAQKKQVYNLVKNAYSRAVKSVKPGASASQVDKTARRVISRKGYGRQFIHSTGHGVGLEIHEAPRLSKSDKTVLRPNMVVTVEPGVYLSGEFGVRIEDSVLVTKNGRKVLTQ